MRAQYVFVIVINISVTNRLYDIEPIIMKKLPEGGFGVS
jgi:hypothetical protein